MGTKYTSKTISGYNATPPADDGTVTESNKVKWSYIKTKLTDTLKTLTESINSALATHFDNGPTAITTETTLGATHYNQVIQANMTSDLILSDASSLTAGWYCDILNIGSTSFNLTRATASDTIDAVSADIKIYPLDTIRVIVNAAATGFMTENRIDSPHKGADVASANDTVLISGDNFVDMTGTTTVNGMTTPTGNPIQIIQYDGAVPLAHATAPSAGFSQLFLIGGASRTTAAGDVSIFQFDGTYWRELATNSNATATTRGLVELATSAEALAGADTTRAVTSAGLASGLSSAQAGYMKLPGGLIIQWDSAFSVTGSSTATRSWPLTWPTGAYVVMGNADSTAALNVNKVYAGVVSTTQVKVTNNGDTANCGYIAIGV